MGVGPLLLDVVDLELAVGGDPAGLDGGEVHADDGRRGVFVGKFDGPDTCAGAEVEDGGGGRGQGREVERPVEGEAPDVVLKVWRGGVG